MIEHGNTVMVYAYGRAEYGCMNNLADLRGVSTDISVLVFGDDSLVFEVFRLPFVVHPGSSIVLPPQFSASLDSGEYNTFFERAFSDGSTMRPTVECSFALTLSQALLDLRCYPRYWKRVLCA